MCSTAPPCRDSIWRSRDLRELRGLKSGGGFVPPPFACVTGPKLPADDPPFEVRSSSPRVLLLNLRKRRFRYAAERCTSLFVPWAPAPDRRPLRVRASAAPPKTLSLSPCAALAPQFSTQTLDELPFQRAQSLS